MSIKLLFEEIAKELNESQFSMWEYKLPKDPEVMLYDFYFLSMFLNDIDTGDEDLDYSLKEATKVVSDGLQKHMIRAVKWSLSCEFRHVVDGEGYQGEWVNSKKLSKKTRSFLEEYEDLFMSGKSNKSVSFKDAKKRIDPISKPRAEDSWQKAERLRSYRTVMSVLKNQNLTNSDFAEITADCFNSLKWDSGYGGKSWGRIAKGWGNLVNAKTIGEKFTWIDHVYDLQHNSDTVFDKVSLYYKADQRGTDPDWDDDEVGFEWLKAALDWKRDVKDVREYYDIVSPQLKPVVAFVSKSYHQKTMEAPLSQTHKAAQKPWEGRWKGGTWEGGRWLDGVWEKGEWKRGIWENGTWENGTWINGEWLDGTWKKGTWKNGTWRDGKWLGGEWLKGTWEVGEIWSKRFKRFFESFMNPRSFYKEEAKAKSAKDLADRGAEW